MKKHKSIRNVVMFVTLLLLSALCAGGSCHNSSTTTTAIVRSTMQTTNGTDSLSIGVYLDNLTPVKTFLAAANNQDLTFEHWTGEFEGNDEIIKIFSTQTQMSKLCQDVAIDTIALLVQVPAGIAEGDVDVALSNAEGALNDLTVTAVTGDVMAIEGYPYVVEDDMMLFMATAPAAFFNNTGWVNFDITINNVVFTDTFQMKGVIAVKVACGVNTYYAPIIPASFTFANMPAYTVTKSDSHINTPTPENLPAPSATLTYITGTNYAAVNNGGGGGNNDNGICFIQTVR